MYLGAPYAFEPDCVHAHPAWEPSPRRRCDSLVGDWGRDPRAAPHLTRGKGRPIEALNAPATEADQHEGIRFYSIKRRGEASPSRRLALDMATKLRAS